MDFYHSVSDRYHLEFLKKIKTAEMVDEKRACLFDRKYDYRKETNVEYRSCISPKTQRLNHLFTFKEMTFGREFKKNTKRA